MEDIFLHTIRDGRRRRRGGGARPRGEAQLVVIWSEGGAEERVASQTVRWDPEHPRRVFALRDRALTEVAGGAP